MHNEIQNVGQFMGGLTVNSAGMLMESRFDTGCLRPMLAENGRAVVRVNNQIRPVNNALLQTREWIVLDDAVQRVARDRLAGIADLRAAGLVRPNGGLGTMIHEYEKISDLSEASVSMNVGVQGENDNQAYSLAGVPVPIISKPFSIDIRRLEASRRRGEGLDTTSVESATRRVSELAEDILFNGCSTIKVDDRTIAGYYTYGDRITGVGADFTHATDGPKNAVNTVLAMIAAAEAAFFPGPFVLYLNTVEYAALRKPLDTTNYSLTAWDYISKLPQIKAIKASMKVTAGTALLVQLTSDVVDLSLGADIQVVQWTELAGMLVYFMVFCAMAPRLKSDYNGKCGIVHYTGC